MRRVPLTRAERDVVVEVARNYPPHHGYYFGHGPMEIANAISAALHLKWHPEDVVYA